MRIRVIKDRVLIKQIPIEVSKYIIAPNSDSRGTWRKSLRPGSLGLFETDEGLVRGSIGQIVDIKENKFLKNGDFVIFRQGESLKGMSIKCARKLAEMYNEPVEIHYYVMSVASIVGLLPAGKPKDGEVQ